MLCNIINDIIIKSINSFQKYINYRPQILNGSVYTICILSTHDHVSLPTKTKHSQNVFKNETVVDDFNH